MEKALFETLLNEEESDTLDVKSEQYPFAKATEEQKSEILKDILVFANTPRTSDAYILIGVAEVCGGRHKVVGIRNADHIPDHTLQQFVRSKTDRPVHFLYEAFGFEEKQIGIIRIAQQQPFPICLKRNYGKLRKDEVYSRKGSSTDLSKPASPAEIAQMAQTWVQLSAELTVEFADVTRDSSVGSKLTWDAEFLDLPPFDQIPDLKPRRISSHSIGGVTTFHDPFDSMTLNPSYLRELAEFEYIQRLFHPVRFVVENVGEVASKNVRCELSTQAGVDVQVLDTGELPEAPERNRSVVGSVRMKNIKAMSRQSPGDVSINKNDERYLIEFDCGDMQPGRRVWSDVFYVGKGETGAIELNGRIYAENLPQPKEFLLAIAAKVSITSMTVNDLRELPEPSE